MRLIFCGTPQFAVPTLEKLIGAGFSTQLVVTNPDEPAGRGYQTKSPPVKQAAERAGLAIFQPRKLKDPETQDYLSSFRPEAIVVVAYGHLIPPWMIELPAFGCVNLHPSLLPKYRGAAPIPWAIIRGERVTGVTTMQIDEGLDSGPILLQRETEIRHDDTTEALSDRLSAMGADLMVETLRGLENGTVEPQPQDAKAATLAPMLSKEDGRIDWSKTAEEVFAARARIAPVARSVYHIPREPTTPLDGTGHPRPRASRSLARNHAGPQREIDGGLRRADNCRDHGTPTRRKETHHSS